MYELTQEPSIRPPVATIHQYNYLYITVDLSWIQLDYTVHGIIWPDHGQVGRTLEPNNGLEDNHLDISRVVSSIELLHSIALP